MPAQVKGHPAMELVLEPRSAPTSLSSTLDSAVDTEGAAGQFLGGACTPGLLWLSALCPHPDEPQAVVLMRALA